MVLLRHSNLTKESSLAGWFENSLIQLINNCIGGLFFRTTMYMIITKDKIAATMLAVGPYIDQAPYMITLEWSCYCQRSRTTTDRPTDIKRSWVPADWLDAAGMPGTSLQRHVAMFLPRVRLILRRQGFEVEAESTTRLTRLYDVVDVTCNNKCTLFINALYLQMHRGLGELEK